jgi:ubiquinone/menaquinone biosynthesis C-methylase UbiE
MISRRASFGAFAALALRGQDRTVSMFANAEAYQRFMGRWSSLVAPPLIDFAKVPDAGRMLDVGSGIGTLAFEIARRKPKTHVIGIDLSKEYVAFANSKNAFPDRASFQIGDAQELHFPNAAFQSSLSLLVFNFIPDRAKALREVSRVTTAGGSVSAAVWDYGKGMVMLRAFWDAASSIDDKAKKLDESHMPLCRAGELSQLWKQGGLENVHEQALDITMMFQNFADYWHPFLLGQGPAGAYAHTVQDTRLQALREAVKQRLSISDESRSFTLPSRVWAVRGTVPH